MGDVVEVLLFGIKELANSGGVSHELTGMLDRSTEVTLRGRKKCRSVWCVR